MRNVAFRLSCEYSDYYLRNFYVGKTGCYTAPANKVSFAAPIYVSPPKHNYSVLFRFESIDKFFADPPFYDSSVPLKSASPSFNVLTSASHPPSMDERPPKR